jgi:hypothetical protein
MPANSSSLSTKSPIVTSPSRLLICILPFWAMIILRVRMGVIEDMLKALDRIPGWARLQQVPNEVDELKAKVAALEEKLGGKWPPDVCRFCGERAVRLRQSSPRGMCTKIGNAKNAKKPMLDLSNLSSASGRTRGFRTSPSTTRVAAGAFGFLTLIQVFDGPERYGARSPTSS